MADGAEGQGFSWLETGKDASGLLFSLIGIVASLAAIGFFTLRPEVVVTDVASQTAYDQELLSELYLGDIPSEVQEVVDKKIFPPDCALLLGTQGLAGGAVSEITELSAMGETETRTALDALLLASGTRHDVTSENTGVVAASDIAILPTESFVEPISQNTDLALPAGGEIVTSFLAHDIIGVSRQTMSISFLSAVQDFRERQKGRSATDRERIELFDPGPGVFTGVTRSEPSEFVATFDSSGPINAGLIKKLLLGAFLGWFGIMFLHSRRIRRNRMTALPDTS